MPEQDMNAILRAGLPGARTARPVADLIGETRSPTEATANKAMNDLIRAAVRRNVVECDGGHDSRAEGTRDPATVGGRP